MDVFMSLFSTFVVEREWFDGRMTTSSTSPSLLTVSLSRAEVRLQRLSKQPFAATLFPSANEATLCMGYAVRKCIVTLG